MRLKYFVVFAALSMSPLLFGNVYAAPKISGTPKAGIAATVNGTMISYLDHYNLFQREASIRNLKVNSKEYNEQKDALSEIAMNMLIDETLLLLEAKSQGIDVSDAEIDAEIANTIKNTGLTETAFYKEVEKSGITKEDYRKMLYKTLVTQTLVARNVLRKIIITEDEILKFYIENGGSNLTNVEVALIVYPSAGVAMEMGPKVQSGSLSFENTAKSVSVGPNADSGGSFGEMSLSDLASPIQFQVQKLEAGEVSNVFSLGDQEAQIKLISKGKTGTTPLDVMNSETYQKISNHLRQAKAGNRVQEYISQLKSKAIINIKD